MRAFARVTRSGAARTWMRCSSNTSSPGWLRRLVSGDCWRVTRGCNRDRTVQRILPARRSRVRRAGGPRRGGRSEHGAKRPAPPQVPHGPSRARYPIATRFARRPKPACARVVGRKNYRAYLHNTPCCSTASSAPRAQPNSKSAIFLASVTVRRSSSSYPSRNSVCINVRSRQ